MEEFRIYNYTLIGGNLHLVRISLPEFHLCHCGAGLQQHHVGRKYKWTVKSITFEEINKKLKSDSILAF